MANGRSTDIEHCAVSHTSQRYLSMLFIDSSRSAVYTGCAGFMRRMQLQQMEPKRILACDLNGTLSRTDRVRGSIGEPLPGAMDWLSSVVKEGNFQVAIVSVRPLV